ncbi:phage tail protein [Hymenobacter jeollabukensis]|uniref:Phage tail protein n=2 Tax=Hymenobacter jeollabukensis TaxID=2025313 RepID=A0A5R8WV14_9BACT|nr:phage tail protein [Hymenobacter jeollabukensis]
MAGGLLLGNRRPAQAEVLSTQGLDPFLGEIMMVSFNFAPQGWAFCNGQQLPINQNQALFALLGTTYGGNGQTTFALPDLRGRIPVSDGGNFALGQRGGAESHTLTLGQLVPHIHGIKSSTALGDLQVSGVGTGTHHYLADSGGGAPQYGGDVNAALATIGAGGATVNTTSSIGGNQAHSNMQPFLCINFVIALQGVFPSTT